MKNLFNQNSILGTILGILAIFSATCVVMAETANWRSQLPDQWHDQEKDAMDAVLDQFVQQSDPVVTGNLQLSTAGNHIVLATNGTAAYFGRVILVNGSNIVATTAVNAKSRIFLTYGATNGTVRGILGVGAISVGTNFTICSMSNTVLVASDTGTVDWLMIDAP